MDAEKGIFHVGGGRAWILQPPVQIMHTIDLHLAIHRHPPGRPKVTSITKGKAKKVFHSLR